MKAERYIGVIENLHKSLKDEWLKFALVGVMEVALEAKECGELSDTEIETIERIMESKQEEEK